MSVPVFVARLRVTNDGGTFDSLGSPQLGAPRPRIRFTASASLRPEPNDAKIEIFNLAPSTVTDITGKVRRRVEWTAAERADLLAAGADASPYEAIADGFNLCGVELSWGYVDSEDSDIEPGLSVGFTGLSKYIKLESRGTDNVLVIEASDGGDLLGAGEVVQRSGAGTVGYRAKSYAPGTDLVDVLVDLINACGVSVDKARLADQLAAAFAAKDLPAAETKLVGGYSASGPALPQLQAVFNALDLRWTVYNGEILILDSDSVLPGFEPLQLSSARQNIIGQPQRKESGALEVKTGASTLAIPGRQVDVETGEIAASYRIEEMTTTGDTESGAETKLLLDELQTIPGLF